MSTQHEAFIKPGAGVEVEQERLAPIRSELLSGTYEIDEFAQQHITAALADPELPVEDVKDALNVPTNKGFRNAYTSLVLEQVWPDYERRVASGELQRVGFTDGRSHLTAISPEPSALTAENMARLIAATNQDVPTHLVCQAFQDGRIPVISGDPTKDYQYFEAFQQQAELLTTRTDSFFPTVPVEMGAPTRFIASGLLVLRTHVFGVPNLMDGVADHQGLTLNPAQHRTGFETTMNRSITHYYLPSGPLTIAINSQLIDPSTGQLRPGQWTSNRDVNNFTAFPRPEIVLAANQAASEQGLPAQTNCPAFHSRVPAGEKVDSTIPLPRSLASLALRQLDDRYYPLRQGEFDRSPGTFFVERPDWVVSQAHALEPSFPNGLFAPGAYIVRSPEATGLGSEELTEREEHALAGMGGEADVFSFGVFMHTADSIIAAQELGGATPSEQHRSLQRFYRRVLVDADRAFDTNRNSFSKVADDTRAFSAALYAIPITRLGEDLTVSFGEALTIFDKAASDPTLYPDRAQAAISEASQNFWRVGVMGMSRSESTGHSARQTQQVKETTNGLYAGLLFDIAYAQSIDHPGYATARDRYIATKLAYQYNDEILDVLVDEAEGSSNLLNALAAENGELEALREATKQLEAARPSDGLDLENPGAVHGYCKLLAQLAPKSYALVAARQHELLRQAALPPEVSEKVALPL